MNPISVSGLAAYQPNLFRLEGAPAGLLSEPEIMTAIEEAGFLDVIKTLPFGAFRMHGVDAKRRVVRFGVHYVAGSAAMRPVSDFPRDEVREEWQHSIPPVKESRWSITFRTLRTRESEDNGIKWPT